jgi:hypothetical protein
MNEKSERVVMLRSRLRETELLTEIPTFLEQLSVWTSDNMWYSEAINDLEQLVSLLENIIKETDDGS